MICTFYFRWLIIEIKKSVLWFINNCILHNPQLWEIIFTIWVHLLWYHNINTHVYFHSSIHPSCDFKYAFHKYTVWHQHYTDWNQTDLLWLYQSKLCQYLSLTAWGLVETRAMIPFHTTEHGTRLTVSWLIWSSLS